VILWDPQTVQPIGDPLRGHDGPVHDIAFSPDGKILASGSDDTTIILWDLQSRQRIGDPLRGHGDRVSDIAFSPGGRILISGGVDGTVILWDVDIESWKERACRTANRNLTLLEWKQYLEHEPPRKTCPNLPEGS
jgi:WD40 repeat protein